MSQRKCPDTLVAASHNAGKIAELADLLAPHGRSIVSAAELRLPEPAETGTTYAQNAALKALSAARTANMAAVSDDSGLDVRALDGQPGIYSARWAGPERDFAKAMRDVWEHLTESGSRDHSAAFRCALCLAWPDGHHMIYEGVVRGIVTWPPRGDRGFGYDPFFIANGHTLTFGEMTPADKHAISHRADAFAKLIAHAL